MKLEYKLIETSKIKLNPINPQSRIDTESNSFKILKNAIFELNNKIIQNLVVVKDGDEFILVDGHRRKKCADVLKIPEVPCSIITLETGETIEKVYRQLNLSQKKLGGNELTEIYLNGGKGVLTNQRLVGFNYLETNSSIENVVKVIFEDKGWTIHTVYRTVKGISNHSEKRNTEDIDLIINYCMRRPNITYIRERFLAYSRNDLWSKIVNDEDL